MTTITIVYGEMGAGKSYHGKALALTTKSKFLEGDYALPPYLKDRVSSFKPLTEEMLYDFIHKHLFQTILREADSNIVVAQALYRRKNRNYLASQLFAKGFNVKFHLVEASFWRNAKQLWQRPKGYLWVMYWLLNKPFFQK